MHNVIDCESRKLKWPIWGQCSLHNMQSTTQSGACHRHLHRLPGISGPKWVQSAG